MDWRRLKDLLASRLTFFMTCFPIILLFLIGLILFLKGKPLLEIKSLKDILFSLSWHPSNGNFGLGSFILGTLWVVTIALIIAVPLSVLTAVYISEFAPKKLKEFSKPLIDLLAGISPVVYGVWGILVVVPIIRDYIIPFFNDKFPFFPFRSDNFTGFSVLAGGIVLAVMIFPIIISIVEDVMSSVPFEMREASLALGATKWETVKYVVIRKAFPGIIAGVVLGLSRAFGETMAVLMVSGCALNHIPKSIFDPAYPLPALIANTYGEMMSVPLYDSAILFSAFVLLILTAIFNVIGWSILLKIESRG